MRSISLIVCALVGLAGFTLRAEERRKSGSSTRKKSTAEEATPRPKSKTGGFQPRTSSTPKPTSGEKAAAKSDDDEPATPKPRPRKSAEPEPASDPEAKPKPTSGKKPVAKSDDEEPATPKPRSRKSAEPEPASDPEAKPKPASGKKPAAKSDDEEPATPKPRPRKSAESEPASTPDATPAPKREHAPAATLDPQTLAEFTAQPARIQDLIGKALDLTKLNLTYTYGSADPAQGGMDCSGTIYHLLTTNGFKDVPRDSSGQYAWVRKEGKFFAVVSRKADGFEFSDLKPGDLLFWTGTYQTGRDIPVSHVMLYLGVEKKRKQRVMFGSSDGRSYDGLQRWGVSVFDFKMPRTEEGEAQGKPGPVFVGYGRIPGLREAVEPELKVAAETLVTEPTATPTPAPKRKKTEPAATPTPAPKHKKKSSTKRE
jgi:cell wall-associated NlpC family hydrolase